MIRSRSCPLPTAIPGGSITRSRSDADLYVAELQQAQSATPPNWRKILPQAPHRPMVLPSSPYEGLQLSACLERSVAQATRRAADSLDALLPGGLHAVSIEPMLPIGYSGNVALRVLVNGRLMFAKACPDTAQARTALALEARWTAYAARCEAGPQDVVHDHDRGIMFTEFLPGAMVPPALLTQEPYLQQVMRALKRLHSGGGPKGVARTPVWQSRPLQPSLTATVRARLMPELTAEALTQYGKRLEAALAEHSAPVAPLHGDPHDGNVRVCASTHHATLIDYDRGHFGDPMLDLAYFALTTDMAMSRLPELLRSYHGDAETAAQERDLPRLQLQLAMARLERYASRVGWCPRNHADRMALTQHMHEDLSLLRI